jgi:hypothetical protein
MVEALMIPLAAAEAVTAYGQSAAFIIGQPHAPAAQLPAEDSILCQEVRQGLLLSMVRPTGQRRKKNPHRGEIDHGGSLYHRLRC